MIWCGWGGMVDAGEDGRSRWLESWPDMVEMFHLFRYLLMEEQCSGRRIETSISPQRPLYLIEACKIHVTSVSFATNQ